MAKRIADLYATERSVAGANREATRLKRRDMSIGIRAGFVRERTDGNAGGAEDDAPSIISSRP